jgi:hypothetical protein
VSGFYFLKDETNEKLFRQSCSHFFDVIYGIEKKHKERCVSSHSTRETSGLDRSSSKKNIFLLELFLAQGVM